MTVSVQNENINDATIQVSVIFDRASRRRRSRSTQGRNNARLRDHHKRTLSTGRNKAEHQSSTKKRRYRKKQRSLQQKAKLKALPAPKPKSPA